MSLELRKEIAAKGGASVPAHKRSFATQKGLAAKAGYLGGKAEHPGGRGHRPRKV